MDTTPPARTARLPLLTLLLGGLAAIASLSPALACALQFDRTLIASGQIWRLFTGHFAHWTASHLAWDLAAFTLLGILLERRSRPLLAATLAASSLSISGAVVALQPEPATYRGLSGIDCALFAAFAMRSLADARAVGRRLHLLLSALALFGLLAKLAAEHIRSAPLFVAPSSDFLPVPLAHLTGALAGLAVAACTALPKHRRR